MQVLISTCAFCKMQHCKKHDCAIGLTQPHATALPPDSTADCKQVLVGNNYWILNEEAKKIKPWLFTTIDVFEENYESQTDCFS